MSKRAGSVVGWICAILVGALHILSGVMKFLPVTPGTNNAVMIEQLGIAGLEPKLGVLQLTIAILFLIPRTSTVGFVLLIGYCGGVLATNLTHGMPFAAVAPIYVMFILLTISAYFRNPELLSRIKNKI
jgi:hypothetical protein